MTVTEPLGPFEYVKLDPANGLFIRSELEADGTLRIDIQLDARGNLLRRASEAARIGATMAVLRANEGIKMRAAKPLGVTREYVYAMVARSKSFRATKAV